MVIVVAGEADWTTADRLLDQVLDALGPPVERLTLELGGLTFCNLRGLGALHQAVEAARGFGIDVTVRGMSGQLAWLHASFPDRLSTGGRQDLVWWSAARRGSLVVESAPSQGRPWESSGTG
nr:STAS domain-containing protein [Blastococcus saxobsidens]